MGYHTSTEFKAEVEVSRRSKKDTIREIINEALTQALGNEFSELEFEVEIGDGEAEIEFEAYDTKSYGTSAHYEIPRFIIQKLHDEGFDATSVSHSTELIEQEEEDETEE